MKAKALLSLITSTVLLLVSGLFATVLAVGVAHAHETETLLKEALVRDLTKKGFQVSEGYARQYTFDDCVDYTYPSLKSCFLANPAAPYVLPVVKSWPDEYVDPATVNAFVETDPGYSATFRLDPREATVMFGKMPPPGPIHSRLLRTCRDTLRGELV